ncbi:hypothetical protein COT42_00820 [Candidatus Saganbacteria bacterium CG08_land_8_20_14_0_20_45_16]|uniref:Uncharacterized protein n=1 Tax=Candidatus Saganbacteria bacterium CG08_land_8_20_14_0_20_45_16 TaxID=2014293 RepID=A0A2H0Y285_UNCSA|nr:MAG: hypothetical protein COT42_00820 [Candidatus Saganbacteria bacterium CG08_land_8_20_14_0_20_45_16]
MAVPQGRIIAAAKNRGRGSEGKTKKTKGKFSEKAIVGFSSIGANLVIWWRVALPSCDWY